jgi:DNA-directed RNA polymerase subunit RPC12/RpoP
MHPVNIMAHPEDGKLVAVHVCKTCGANLERAQVQPEDLLSGLISCPNCGKAGPLNIEIVGPTKKRPPKSVRKTGTS